MDGKREGKGTAVLSDGSRYIGTLSTHQIPLIFLLRCFLFHFALFCLTLV